MKTNDTMTGEEVLIPARRFMRPPPTRRLRPPPDELPPSSKRGDTADIKARLDRLNRRGRFSQPVDLKPLAVAWANDYVSHVFPDLPDTQSNQLLLAAEVSFLAAIEMGKIGIRHWERLLEGAKSTREHFLTK